MNEVLNCKKCGKEISNSDKICKNCGVKIINKSKKKLYLIISVVVIILFVVILLVINHKSIVGTYKQYDGVGTTIIINKNKSCFINIEKQDENYPTTISNCYWDMKDNKITIYFTMSMSSFLVPSYTKDNKMVGTFDGMNIIMDGGSTYYRQ